MKTKHTYIFVISLLLCIVAANAQVNETGIKKTQDTLRRNNSYGLRVGVDLQQIVTSLTNPRFQGIEFMGDYRISDKYFLAAELGNQEKTINEPNVNTTASGSYIKAGIDYNAYKNLIGLRNVIFVGLRYGYANFSQELNRFSFALQDDFFEREVRDSDLESTGLSAHWLEIIGGLKVELLKNVYVGFSVSVRRKIIEQTPTGFDNHFIPGFGTTNDFGNVSADYRYFISYYFPLYKRNKKVKNKEKESTDESN